jgi:hypothetical protein
MNVAVKPLATPPAGAGAPDEAEIVLRYVRRMQRDGRLLLRHIAGRADRALPAATPTPLLPTLFADAAAVAADPAELDRLADCVDALSRAASPATAASIRLTRAYLRSTPPDDDVTSPEILRRGMTLRTILKVLAGCAMLAVVVTLWLLAHVDDGRRSLQQLQSVRGELRATYEELGRMPATAWLIPEAPEGTLPGSFRHVCGDGKDGGRVPAETPEGARAAALCDGAWQAGLREDLVLMRIAHWNCPLPDWLPFGIGDGCATPPGKRDDWGRVTERHWERTEMRIEATIATYTGFYLPLLMGFIGGAAFVLRQLDQKLSQSTLEPRDGWHATLRVLLATMLGGLLGAVWSGDAPVNVGGFNLTLAAVAFFVGFALEAVFTLIEAMVESVAGRLRGEPGAAARPR